MKVDNLKIEQEKLKRIIAQQSHDLMQIPRLEEEYHRAARHVVRQKEIAMNTQDINWKKTEEEVKALGYWKNRSCLLEEQVNNQEKQLEALQKENRKLLNKSLQWINSESFVERNGLKSTVSPSHAETSKEVELGTLKKSKQSRRPKSAVNANTGSYFEEDTSQFNKEEGLDAKFKSNHNRELFYENDTDNMASTNKSSNTTGQTNTNKNVARKKLTIEESNQNEQIQKLLHKNNELEVKVHQLAAQLSYARSHPLQAMKPLDDFHSGIPQRIDVDDGNVENISLFSATISETDQRAERAEMLKQKYVNRVRQLKVRTPSLSTTEFRR